MSHVAVTGAAGPVGRRLVALLAADATVERIIAIDREPLDGVPSDEGDERVEAHQLHLRDAELAPLLADVDVVCHLAGSDPLEGTPSDHDLHTTSRLLEAAGTVGVGHVIVRTSATVYGARPDNPVPLSETASPRPGSDAEWVRVRTMIERHVADFATEHPGTVVSIVRPCVTVSSEGPDELGRVLAAARLVASPDGSPPAQFVHADDVASAIDTIRLTGAPGAYNVAPDGALDAELIRALVGGAPRVPLPEWLARRLTAFGWRYQLAPTPPGFVPFVNHPWVVANDKLRALGWVPEHTNEEAFVAGHAAAPWASISPQRRQELALVASVVVAMAALAGAGAAVRRRLR